MGFVLQNFSKNEYCIATNDIIAFSPLSIGSTYNFPMVNEEAIVLKELGDEFF